MRKPAAYLFAILVGAIVWFFFQHFNIEGTERVRVVPKTEEELNREDDATPKQKPLGRLTDFFASKDSKPGEEDNAATTGDTGQPPDVRQTQLKKEPKASPKKSAPAQRVQDRIRIASFHLKGFGSPMYDSSSLRIVANVIRSFDISALQGISPTGMSALTDLARAAGPSFAVLVDPRRSFREHDEVFAYIYNEKSIVADRGDGLYTLIDRGNGLDHDPLIGWFRAKRANEKEAFTFTLVNVNTSPSRALQELNLLDDAMHAIRNDGRDEDDVIMLGAFQAPPHALGQLGQVPGLYVTLRDPDNPQDLLGTAKVQNIVFKTPETDEFTRAGIYNYVRQFDLTSHEARTASDYFPIWAEFSIYEGGRPGRVASRGRRTHSRF